MISQNTFNKIVTKKIAKAKEEQFSAENALDMRLFIGDEINSIIFGISEKSINELYDKIKNEERNWFVDFFENYIGVSYNFADYIGVSLFKKEVDNSQHDGCEPRIAVVDNGIYESLFNKYNGDFLVMAFHHGKVMSVEEYVEYHNDGKDKNDKVEYVHLYTHCVESCPECNTDVELETKFVHQVCPKCGKTISPCSLCGGKCISPCPLAKNLKKKYKWSASNNDGAYEDESGVFETHKECYDDMRRAALKKMEWNTEFDEDFYNDIETIDYKVSFGRKKIVHESYSGVYTYKVIEFYE